MTSPLFSIVSPVYKAETIVPELVRRIKQSVDKLTDNYEIILVVDGSPDKSWLAVKHECELDKRVKGLNLSRNFGQHYAISAGLKYVHGEWIIVMDCDLQDRPEEIPNLYNKAKEGFDIVQTRRVNRKDGFFKQLSGKIFHKIYDWLSGMHTDRLIGNMGIYSRQVICEFNNMPETARSFTTLLQYLGFRKTTLDIEHSERFDGKSSYTLRTLLKLTFDVIISDSNKPLRMAVALGFIMSILSLGLALYNIIAKLLGIIDVAGYTTTVFSIWFVGGVILTLLGVIGLYIGKIFDQVKGRQLYIVMEKENIED